MKTSATTKIGGGHSWDERLMELASVGRRDAIQTTSILGMHNTQYRLPNINSNRKDLILEATRRKVAVRGMTTSIWHWRSSTIWVLVSIKPLRAHGTPAGRTKEKKPEGSADPLIKGRSLIWKRCNFLSVFATELPYLSCVFGFVALLYSFCVFAILHFWSLTDPIEFSVVT